MELRRRLDPKVVLIGGYLIMLAIYIVVGLQPAGAVNYRKTAEVSIPAIGLYSDVTELNLENHKLSTPDIIVGSYAPNKNKTLLIGHSTTAFDGLEKAQKYDLIDYAGHTYQIINIEILEKSQIKMNELLAPADEDTLVVMTCAGELLAGGDATHRLVLTAVR